MTTEITPTEAYVELIRLSCALDEVHEQQPKGNHRRLYELFIRSLIDAKQPFVIADSTTYPIRLKEKGTAVGNSFSDTTAIKLYDLPSNLTYLYELVNAASQHVSKKLDVDGLPLDSRRYFHKAYHDDPKEAVSSLLMRIERIIDNARLSETLRDEHTEKMKRVFSAFSFLPAPPVARTLNSMPIVSEDSEYAFAQACDVLGQKILKKCEKAGIHTSDFLVDPTAPPEAPVTLFSFADKVNTISEFIQEEFINLREKFSSEQVQPKIDYFEKIALEMVRKDAIKFLNARFGEFNCTMVASIKETKSLNELLKVKMDLFAQAKLLFLRKEEIVDAHLRQAFNKALYESGKLFLDCQLPKTIEFSTREIFPKIRAFSEEVMEKQSIPELEALRSHIENYKSCLEEIIKNIETEQTRGLATGAEFMREAVKLLESTKKNIARRVKELAQNQKEITSLKSGTESITQTVSGDGVALLNNSPNSTVNITIQGSQESSMLQNILKYGPWAIGALASFFTGSPVPLVIVGATTTVSSVAKTVTQYYLPTLAPFLCPLIEVTSQMAMMCYGASAIYKTFGFATSSSSGTAGAAGGFASTSQTSTASNTMEGATSTVSGLQEIIKQNTLQPLLALPAPVISGATGSLPSGSSSIPDVESTLGIPNTLSRALGLLMAFLLMQAKTHDPFGAYTNKKV